MKPLAAVCLLAIDGLSARDCQLVLRNIARARGESGTYIQDNLFRVACERGLQTACLVQEHPELLGLVSNASTENGMCFVGMAEWLRQERLFRSIKDKQLQLSDGALVSYVIQQMRQLGFEIIKTKGTYSINTRIFFMHANIKRGNAVEVSKMISRNTDRKNITAPTCLLKGCNKAAAVGCYDYCQDHLPSCQTTQDILAARNITKCNGNVTRLAESCGLYLCNQCRNAK